MNTEEPPPPPSEEETRIILDFNAPADEAPTPSTIHALFEEQAKRRPEAPAISFQQVDLTYAELNRRANRVAHWLQARGVGPESSVALCLERTPDSVVALLAILKAGGAYMPIEPTYPKTRIEFMFEDARPVALLTQRSLLEALPSFSGPIGYFDSSEDEFASEPETPVQSAVEPESLAYIIYTSGSTGKPKGVAVPHRAVERLTRNAGYATLDASVTVLQSAPIAFDASTFELWGPLTNGGRIAFHDERVPTATGLEQAIARYSATTMWLTAALFNSVVDERASALGGLRELLIGGEVLSVPHVRRALDALPNTKIINGYGPTETTTFACCYPIPRDLDPARGPIPIGKAIRQTRLYVMRPSGSLARLGETGELFIGGRGVARGYLNRPELTSERFVPDPFRPGETIYRTGDLVRMDEDGIVHYEGRVDTQVKIRGFRIELGEIEAALAQVAGIKRAAVVVRDDTGDKRLVAYGVPVSPDHAPEVAEIRKSLSEQLPEYMIPTTFLWMSSLPVTDNGKLDYRALPTPKLTRPELSVDFVAPRSEQEARLAIVFEELLGMQGIGVKDNLFELGANSLLVVRAVAKIRDQLGLELPVVKVFQYPTVAGIAHLFADAPKGVAKGAPAKRRRQAESDGIAIVGMAGRFPGAGSVSELWRQLSNGTETVRFFSPEELDASIPEELRGSAAYVPARGVIDGARLFEPSFFGIPPKEAVVLDPQQRVLFEVAWEALESAGYVPEKYDGRVGVFAGKYNNSYYANAVSKRPDLIEEIGEFQVMVDSEKDYVATLLAHRLDLRGPAVSVHTACSTSLVATVQAVGSLEAGQCDMALAGGASITVPINSGHIYNEGAMLSADGHTRTFDAKASGTVFSDGVAMLVLKRLEDALSDGDTIYGVIRGVGLNNDGANRASFTAPSVEGQAAAITMAMEDAGVSPNDIDYVEAHGTATPLGDPLEVEALTRSFQGRNPDLPPCGLGSIKSNLGHLVIAAGATGLIKTALSLKNELIPASLHYSEPNPRIDFSSGYFRVVSEATPWPRSNRARYAGVSAFGVGGTNAHVIVQEPPVTEQRRSSRSSELLLLSARSTEALEIQARQLAAHLDSEPDLALGDVALTLHSGRRDFRYRVAVVASGVPEAAEALRTVSIATEPCPGTPPDVVFMFPGQGSQHLSMGAQLFNESSEFKGHVEECLTHLDNNLAERLRALVFANAPNTGQDELNQTSLAQPALFIVEYALAQLWQSYGIKPCAAIGHSVGEFVAATIASVFTLADALSVVTERGRLMQALPAGAMLSVRASASSIEPRLRGALALAADNSPTLCVVSGPHSEVEAFQQALEGEGIACRRLQTSHAFHSSMMQPAVEPLRTLLKGFELSPAKLPIVSTVTGTALDREAATSPDYWARQLVLPVRFGPAVAAAIELPSRLLLEVGPRQTLTTLARQQIPGRKRPVALSSLGTDPADAGTKLRSAAGALYTLGLRLNPEPMHAPSRRVPLPTYPFQRKSYWVDSPSNRTATPTPASTRADIAPAADTSIATPGPRVQPNALTHEGTAMVTAHDSRRPQLIDSLCQLLEEASGIEVTPEEADAPFLDLGLDSLFLTQYALSVRRKFSIDVSFRELQDDCPSLAALADRLLQQLPPDSAAIAPAPAPQPAAAAAEAPQSHPGTALLQATAAQAAQVPAMPAASMTVGNTFSTADLQGLPAQGTNPIYALVAHQLQLTSQLMGMLVGGVPSAPTPQATPSPIPSQPTIGAVPPEHAPPAPATQSGASIDGPPVSAPRDSGPSSQGANGQPGSPRYDVKKAFGAIARIHQARSADELTPHQRARLEAFIRRYNDRTAKSKKFAQDNRRHMADPRVVTGFRPLTKELCYPIVVERSGGSKLWDIDGNEYIDALNGFGLNLFGWQPKFVTQALHEQLEIGHEIGPQTPLAAEVARLFCDFTGFDRAAFCNTGSEAVMGCIRIARTVTGRNTIVVFKGAYHGIFDEVLVRGTKSLRSIPAAPGILPDAFKNVLVLDYGTPQSLEILRARADDLAAILVEPVQSRAPNLRPRDFLFDIRELTERANIAYIFDEVVCGFRLRPGGAQEFYGLKADLASYGKVVGGGLPIGVIAGKSRFMDALDGGFWQFGDESVPPVGVTYFAGTFVRHPLALAACRAVLLHLKEEGPELQQRLNARVESFVSDLKQFIEDVEAPITVQSCASLWRLTYTSEQAHGDLLFYMMRERGVHIWDGFPCFFTTAHSDEDFQRIAKAFKESVLELLEGQFLPGKRTGKTLGAPDHALNPNAPPVPGARLGRDREGNPAWFVPSPSEPGKYVQLTPS